MIAFIDVVDVEKKIYYYAIFDDDRFIRHHIHENQNSIKEIKNCDKVICYDIEKIYDAFDLDYEATDVRVLYELTGHKFYSFTSLCDQKFSEEHTQHYKNLNNRVQAHLKSYKTTKIDVAKLNEFVQLFPENLIHDLYQEKAKLVLKLYNDHQIELAHESFYDGFLRDKQYILYAISKNTLRVNLDDLNSIPESLHSHLSSCVDKNNETRIRYNICGAKNGRLTCKKNSFNILNLPKKHRNIVLSHKNYCFVQFDFKSFQPNLAIHSTDDEKFKDDFAHCGGDIYEFFDDENKTRDQVKLEFLTWMYAENNNHPVFDVQAKPIKDLRKRLFQEIKRKGFIKNLYGRPLYYYDDLKENVLFQNYIASLEIDTVLLAVKRVQRDLNLGNYKSFISFILHDAIIMQVHKNEMPWLDSFESTIENTPNCGPFNTDTIFFVDVKIGENFGNLEKI